MQKSHRRSRRNKKSWDEPSIPIVMPTCPRCGDAKTRRSSKKTNDKLLKVLFYKSYRCRACRHRFWVINPLRLVVLPVGTILVLAPLLGAFWMASTKQPIVARIVPATSKVQLKRLAEKGDATAELQTGLRYSSSAWGIKDDKIAAQWFEKAARHDLVEGQYRYGLALLEGQGVVQDYKAAFYWLEKAARQGNAEAQFSFGEMYQSGFGIKSDVERAYLWFNLAASQGVEKAASARDLVVKLLTPNQISAMQEEASRISHAQHSKPVATSVSKAEVKEPDRSTSADEPTSAAKQSFFNVFGE